jgi:hypothetical protein
MQEAIPDETIVVIPAKAGIRRDIPDSRLRGINPADI